MSTDATLTEVRSTPAKSTARDGLIFTFVTNIDYAIVATLLPVVMLHGDRVSAADFSLAVSIRVVASIVGMLCAPVFFSRTRSGHVLMLASALKGIAFAVLCITIGRPGLCLFAILAGLGTGVSKPAIRTLLTNASTADNRAKIFQLFFVMMNAALVAGPFVARLAVAGGNTQAFLVGLAGVEFLAGLWIMRASHCISSGVPQTAPFSLSRVFGFWLDARVAPILALSFASYFAMGFMLTGFLLYQNVVPGLASHREAFLSFEALATIVIQLAFMPVFRKLGRPLLYTLSASGAGIGIFLSYAGAVPLVLLGLALFALAECLVMPQTQLEVSRVVPVTQTAGVFSAVTLAGAIGESAGSICVGYVIQWGGALFPTVANAAQWMALPVCLAFLLSSLLLLRPTKIGAPAPAASTQQ